MYSVLTTSLVIALSLQTFVICYKIQDTSDAMQYLVRFGYIRKNAASRMNLIDVKAVFKQFQHMAGINETGNLDGETMKMMNMPRCGNPDINVGLIPDSDKSKKRKRYAFFEPIQIWNKRELTYRISHYSKSIYISRKLINRDIARAFRLWEEAANLKFFRSNNPEVDIELSFEVGDHYDGVPFDGPGEILAHGFAPGPYTGGDVHFDDSETWTVNSKYGINLLMVAVHEIGHALGLDHSDVPGSIMQAFYGGYQRNLKLHPDDVAGIQHFYGKPGINQ